MSYVPQAGSNKTRSPSFAVQFENVINSSLPSRRKIFSTLPSTTTPLVELQPAPSRPSRSVGFFPLARSASRILPRDNRGRGPASSLSLKASALGPVRAQINRLAFRIGQDFGENAGDLQAG